MSDAWPLLQFYQGALTYTDYLAMPGPDRRAAIDHMSAMLRAQQRQRRARK